MQTSTARPERPDFSATTPLADLVAGFAGASRVFQRHGLDYCCRGDERLGDACRRLRLPVDTLLDELRREVTPVGADVDWRRAPLPALIAHVVDHFHQGHRAELPRLLAMAEKVERVHAGKPDCPRGLAQHLHDLLGRLEAHMQKEEQVLFPMALRGDGRLAEMPVQCMEQEHVEHGEGLARMRELAHDFEPPAEACGTWRALYVGLREFEREVMEHVHLENHVLFPRVLDDSGAEA